MKIQIFPDALEMSRAAARHAAASLARAVERRGHARVVAATAASQIQFQDRLTSLAGIPWERVELFQLDEYVGLPHDHPACFRRMLREHLIDKIPIATCHLLDGQHPEETCDAVGRALTASPIDIAFLGIGENAHLAFNDPPADFDNTEPYAVVALDEACRRQQVGEGWFPRLEDVPRSAVSMTIRQILQAREILVIVPDHRKAAAVQAAVEAEITPAVPASILRTHGDVTLFLDAAAASRLAPASL